MASGGHAVAEIMLHALREKGFNSKIYLAYNIEDTAKMIQIMNDGDILVLDDSGIKSKSIGLVKQNDISG